MMEDNGAPGDGRPSPPQISIDREGNWFADGNPVAHEKILRLFQESLAIEDGRHILRIGNETNPVAVEDAPFVARQFFVENTEDGTDVARLTLNGGLCAELDPGTLRAAEGGALYCSLPGRNGLEARFSRAALSQMAKFLERDEAGGFYLELNGTRNYIDPPPLNED
ncbi:MAG TPA: DUF1285 domain-containing protein [bacterium]|nr:MAG: hypothetical protein BWY28_00295 [bacterium ADurb.Bin236]HOY63108.1 DUF1285 domain-containing protein [bacterium]HPI78597.1 DUF1285 domain-containing protein [bacterium]